MPTPTFFGQNQVSAGSGPPSFPSIGAIWSWWEPSREGLSDNDPMPLVTDQESTRDMEQATSGEQPTYKANQINGLGAARMQNGRWFDLNFDFSGLTASHFFWVVKIDADPPPPGTGAGGWHRNTGAGVDSHYCFENGLIYEDWGTNTRLDAIDVTPALTSWHLYEVISISGEFTVLLDGTQLATRASNTVAWGGSTGGSFGQTAAGNWSNGYWAGAYQFSAKITGADRTSLINYVNTRFGLSSS